MAYDVAYLTLRGRPLASGVVAPAPWLPEWMIRHTNTPPGSGRVATVGLAYRVRGRARSAPALTSETRVPHVPHLGGEPDPGRVSRGVPD